MNLRSFFQILPPRIPYSTAASTPEALPMPSKATLLWADRVPADLAVRARASVRTGQGLARGGKGYLVSTVTGRVEEISLFNGPDGRSYTAVTIQADPRDTFDPSLTPIDDVEGTSAAELRNALFRAGFSSLSALSNGVSQWFPVDTLVISALDSDPTCIANLESFRNQTDSLEKGARLLQKATGASQCVVAVPETLADLARRFSRGQFRLVRVPAVYPNGLPDMLARKYGSGTLIRKKAGGLVGDTLVVSAEETAAAADCLRAGKPFVEKTVSISSGKNASPVNLKVRIGTPVADLLAHRNIRLQPKGKLIINGAMRGYACFSDEQPVTAQTDCVCVQEPGEIFLYQHTACTNCGKCNAACPVDLEVNLLGRCSEYGIFNRCRFLGAENCIECGLCAYVCPARRPLVQLIAHAKQVIRETALEQMNMMTMEEALTCNACGPTCPALRLFEIEPKKETPREAKRE